jgi:adenylate cyclase
MFNTERALPVFGLGLLLLCLTSPTPTHAQTISRWEKELTRPSDSTRKAEVLLFIAKDYETTDPNRALSYAQRAFDIGQQRKQPKIMGLAALELAKLHGALGNKAKARRFRKQADENLRNVDMMAELNRLETQKSQAEETAQAQQQAAASSQQQVTQLSTETQQKTQQLSQKEQQLTQQTQLIGSKDQLLGRKDSLIGQKDQLIGQRDSVLTKRELELRFQTDQIKILEQDRALKAAEAEQERTARNALLAGLAGLLVLAVMLWRLIRTKQKTNQELARKNEQLDTARRRSDELLHNILPEELVNELKVSGITKTRFHDDVTIMFTDFKDFTKISEILTPIELVQEIDHCFRQFDQIIAKYASIEKIKTIGDAYLCVGGLPAANPSHAHDVVAAALEIRDFIADLYAERTRNGKQAFRIRIGVHTGPVVAGVVGATKFAYDIWGDTVNTAARLESASEPGRVNISEVTYQQVQQGFECRYRGQIATKNKAEMGMYFVESARSLQLSE